MIKKLFLLNSQLIEPLSPRDPMRAQGKPPGLTNGEDEAF